ncbi:MAG: protease HtpX [Pseudomonadales bacterium]|nr:protease HtpX [Pseudomonadales bacterium]
MRVMLFLATNLAVIAVASVVLSILGISPAHQPGGGLNLTSLLIMCAVFGFTGSFISLFLSKWMAKRSTGTYIIDSPKSADEKWLLDTVAELSQKAGIKMPEVGIFPSQTSNAFATGWNKNDALVAVSLGLLQRFNRDEVKAVLGHEIGHVANGDMVTLSLIQGVVNTFVMFFARIIGSVVDSFLRGNNNEGGVGIGYWVTTIFAEIVLGFLASGIVAWFSRRREFRADDAGAYLADKNSMINALRRLQAEQQLPSQLPDTMAAFGIRSGAAKGLQQFFATHPPLEDRIAALQSK